MRGEHREDGGLFSYVSIEDRVPKKHPIRKARKLVCRTTITVTGPRQLRWPVEPPRRGPEGPA